MCCTCVVQTDVCIVSEQVSNMAEKMNLVVGEDGNVITEGDFVLILNDEENYEYIQKSILLNNKSNSQSSPGETCSGTLNESGDLDRKLWTRESSLLLISLYEKYEKEFNHSMKKSVWKKIATKMSSSTQMNFTHIQVDTKWKGFLKTYKEILKHNNTSGKNRKKWEYFELIHSILYKKPEINLVATCSSHSGLHVQITTSDGKVNKELPSTPATFNSEYESSFTKKRKAKEDATELRHREKMQRLDNLQISLDKVLEFFTSKK